MRPAHRAHCAWPYAARSSALLSKLQPESFPILSDAVVNTEWEVPSTFSTTYIADPAASVEQMVRQIEESAPATKTPAGAAGAAGATNAAGAASAAGAADAATAPPANGAAAPAAGAAAPEAAPQGGE